MKIILSRKGFDSANGGCPSPILPDGTLLSMPIPSDSPGVRFDEIQCGDSTYADIWRQLKPQTKTFPEFCHLDPDIRPGVRKSTPTDWQPAFGQMDAAQTHLTNQKVGVGDLFLFFGWFRRTEWNEKKKRLRYAPKAPDQHIVYGYLQIGRILTGEEVAQCPWHPHADKVHSVDESNTIFLASQRLCLDGVETDLPGSGILRHGEDLVLTKPGFSRTRWDLPAYFRDVSISYHTSKSFKDDYFQSACIGQEFVISEDPRVTQWAKDLIVKHVEV